MATADGFIDYCDAIWRRRYFWASLVLLDLKNRYKRSALGLGWTLANPIAMTVVLCAVFHTIFAIDLRTYAPFVLSGMAFWNYVSGSVIEGCYSLTNGESYIRATPAPMAIYPLRTTLGLSIHFLITLALTIVVVCLFRGFGNIAAFPWLIPGVAVLFVWCWATAVIFGFLNVFFPDVQHLAGVGMQLLFYLTPIFYPPELLANRGMGLIIVLNPFTHILTLVRSPLLDGTMPPLTSAGIALGATGFMALTAAWMLRRFERTVVFSM